jgi:hypothetical protein
VAAIGINNCNSMVVDMNPRFTINVAVPFDIPPGTNPTVIELHESAFSRGVKVRLEE